MYDFDLTQITLAKQEHYTFSPGQTFNFQAKFSEIPHKYHLQILDKNKNTRLNRYGKGSEIGIDFKWPIPKTVKKHHLGIWEISIKSDTENFSLFFNVKNCNDFFRCE
ncbi:MAG: hypothetical protein ACTSSO_00285 [Candidatus Hodarchaeales archaeon]